MAGAVDGGGEVRTRVRECSVEVEDYELASQLRDQIAELEKRERAFEARARGVEEE